MAKLKKHVMRGTAIMMAVIMLAFTVPSTTTYASTHQTEITRATVDGGYLGFAPLFAPALIYPAKKILGGILAGLGITFGTYYVIGPSIETFARMLSTSTINQLNHAASNMRLLDDGHFMAQISQDVFNYITSLVVVELSHHLDIGASTVVIQQPEWMGGIHLDVDAPIINLSELSGLYLTNITPQDLLRLTVLELTVDHLRAILPQTVTILGAEYTVRTRSTTWDFIAYFDRNGTQFHRLSLQHPTSGWNAIQPTLSDFLGFYITYGADLAIPGHLFYAEGIQLRAMFYRIADNTHLLWSREIIRPLSIDLSNIHLPEFRARVNQPNVLSDYEAALARLRAATRWPDPQLDPGNRPNLNLLIPPSLNLMIDLEPEDVILPYDYETTITDPGTDPGDDTGTDPGGDTQTPPAGDINLDILDDIYDTLTSIDDTLTQMQTESATLPDRLTTAIVGTGQIDTDRIRNTDFTILFPFSIPFDFARAISSLRATPVAPRFEMDFSGTVLDGQYMASRHGVDPSIVGTTSSIVIDLGEFEQIAYVIRWVVWFGFFVGLMMATHKFIKW